VRHVFLAVRRLVFYRSWMVLVRVTIWGQVPVQGRAKTRSCNNKSTSAPRRSLRLLCWPLVGFGQRCSGAHCDTTVMPVLDRKMLIVECLGPDAVFLPACLPASASEMDHGSGPTLVQIATARCCTWPSLDHRGLRASPARNISTVAMILQSVGSSIAHQSSRTNGDGSAPARRAA
jgi:hypothetical protein